jgi:hypothetical protein
MSRCANYATVSMIFFLFRWLWCLGRAGEGILPGKAAVAVCDWSADVRGLGLREDFGRSHSHFDGVRVTCGGAMRGRRR